MRTRKKNRRYDTYGKVLRLWKQPSEDWSLHALRCRYIHALLDTMRFTDEFTMLYLSVFSDSDLFTLMVKLQDILKAEISEDDELEQEMEESLRDKTAPQLPVKDCVQTLFACIDSSNSRAACISLLKNALETLFDASSPVRATSIESMKQLSSAFTLSEDDMEILLFLYIISVTEELDDVMRQMSFSEFFAVLSAACGIDNARCRSRFHPRSPLLKYGLADSGWGQFETFSISDSAGSFLSLSGRSHLFEQNLIPVDDKKAYPLESYDIDTMSSDMAVQLLSSKKPMHILLYGKEGTGKTEYAASLARAAGKKLVKYDNSGKENSKQTDMFNLFAVLQGGSMHDTVMLVDEADEILSTAGFSFFSQFSIRGSSKAAINELLDNAKVPVIWIVNSTEGFDDSTKRRFLFSVEFGQLSANVVRNMARTYTDTLNVSDDVREQIISMAGTYRLNAASLRYARDAVEIIGGGVPAVGAVTAAGGGSAAVTPYVRHLFESNMKLLTGSRARINDTEPEYDLDALNISVSGREIVDAVRRACDHSLSARFLFSGPSGTGKTALASYIARTLDKTLFVKRASDILSPYVGVAESNVARIFDDAEHEGAILFIDEADSFFYSRKQASRSWERSLVNEFLTRMEDYRGVLICATNTPDVFDSAFARRFHQNITFGCLDYDGLPKLVSRYFPNVVFGENDLLDLMTCPPVTPGDIRVVHDRAVLFSRENVTPQFIIASLREAALQRDKNVS